jgi:hypothetical protein
VRKNEQAQKEGYELDSQLRNDTGDGKVFAKRNTMHAISGFGGGEVYRVVVAVGPW